MMDLVAVTDNDPCEFTGAKLTTNGLGRTICIRRVNSPKLGSGFVLDYRDKQYLVTAAHVLEGYARGDNMEVMYQGNWVTVSPKLLRWLGSPGDVAVLELPFAIYPEWPLEAEPKYTIGQECYFLGFPYGLENFNISGLHGAQAFAKKAVVSGSQMTEHGVLLFLDGIGNPGFSGGPVVIFNRDLRRMQVIGVVSSYHPEWRRTVDENGHETRHYHLYHQNSGLVKAINIGTVIKMIEQELEEQAKGESHSQVAAPANGGLEIAAAELPIPSSYSAEPDLLPAEVGQTSTT